MKLWGTYHLKVDNKKSSCYYFSFKNTSYHPSFISSLIKQSKYLRKCYNSTLIHSISMNYLHRSFIARTTLINNNQRRLILYCYLLTGWQYKQLVFVFKQWINNEHYQRLNIIFIKFGRFLLDVCPEILRLS